MSGPWTTTTESESLCVIMFFKAPVLILKLLKNIAILFHSLQCPTYQLAFTLPDKVLLNKKTPRERRLKYYLLQRFLNCDSILSPVDTCYCCIISISALFLCLGDPLPSKFDIVPTLETQNANYLLSQSPSHIEHESINKTLPFRHSHCNLWSKN